MPISYGTFEKQVKLLPINLAADGTAAVTVRYGFVVNGEFSATEEKIHYMSAVCVAEVLDAVSTPGLTRRDDLAFAIYMHLVSEGLVPAGAIS